LTPGAADTERFALTCEAVHGNLAPLLAVVARMAERVRLDPATERDLRLAVEEACVNVIKHGYPGGPPGVIRLSIAAEPGRIVVEIVDDAAPFDPQDAPAPDIRSDWDERRIGGLGWHLIRKVMDEVRHTSRPGGGNRLTLVKHRHTN
jgi:serine/threonine-protein kinase RsbW